VQIVVNCETHLCSQFLGPGDNFLQSYGAIFTDRAAAGSGSLMEPMSTAVQFITISIDLQLYEVLCERVVI
jgi:hypothetical protein